jgi:hypothetical protein
MSCDQGKRFDKKTGKIRKCRDTDKQPLRSRDRLELLSVANRRPSKRAKLTRVSALPRLAEWPPLT